MEVFNSWGYEKKIIQTSSYWWSWKAMKIQGQIVLALALPKPRSKSSSSWPCQSRGRFDHLPGLVICHIAMVDLPIENI